MDYWINLIQDRLLAIEGVESLYITKEGRNVDVWSVIAEHDSKLIRQIAEVEVAFMREYVRAVPDREPHLLFDFHVPIRGEHKEEEIVPHDAMRITRSAA